MLFRRIRNILVLSHIQSGNQFSPRLLRKNHLVDISELRGPERIGELLPVLLGQRLPHFILRVPKQNIYSPLSPHYSNLRIRKSQINIRPRLLTRHDNISPAVCLSSNQCHLRDSCLSKRIHDLRPMPDNPVMLLERTRQKSRHILKSHQRNIKTITKPDKPGRLIRSINVENSGKKRRLVRHDPDRPSPQSRKPDHDILSKIRHHLEKIPVIHDRNNHLFHIIRNIRIIRNHPSQSRYLTPYIIPTRHSRRILHIISRQKTQQLPDSQHHLLLRIRQKMSDPAYRSMRHRSPQLLLADHLVSHRLNHIRTRNKHMTSPPDHKNKIGQSRRITRPPSTRPENSRNLRNHPRSHSIAEKNTCVPGQALHPLLNTRSSRIIQSDHRRTVFQSQILYLHDLPSILRTQRTTKHRKIISIHKHQSAIDFPIPRNDSVSRYF